MKTKFSFLIVLILLIISLIINGYLLLYPQKEIVYSKEKINKNNMISMMIEQNDGTYQENKDNAWPDAKFIFNKELSGCENGSEIVWDEASKSVKVNATSSDKCYAYFDKITFSEFLKRLYTADGDKGLYYHDGLGNYLNSNLEAEDLSYRYSGASQNINNYLCLDGITKENNCNSDADLYRIIGLFLNEADEYEAKIIKYDYALSDIFGTNGDYYGNYPNDDHIDYYLGKNPKNIVSYQWNNNTKNNNWPESYLNLTNINTNYISYLNNKYPDFEKKYIAVHKWAIGGSTKQNIIQSNAKTSYNNEIRDNKVSYEATKIGLTYMSDYYYAADSQYWSLPLYKQGATKSPYGNYRDAATSNWFYMGIDEWSITKDTETTNQVFYISREGVGFSRASNNYALIYSFRPVFYLNVATKFASGDGTYTNPYRLILN